MFYTQRIDPSAPAALPVFKMIIKAGLFIERIPAPVAFPDDIGKTLLKIITAEYIFIIFRIEKIIEL
jgi:hypothetical protein